MNVILSGWVHKKRDHGNLLFIDLRDNFGTTQCIIEKDKSFFKELEKMQLESVIKISGIVSKRSPDTINKDLKTGEIEIKINSYEILRNIQKNFLFQFLVIKNMQKKLD